jgi:hypothetical protein
VQMRARGVVILGTGEHRANPATLVVWLHGPAGQWIDGVARLVVAGIPGVASVVDSVQTPTILLVRVELIESGRRDAPA